MTRPVIVASLVLAVLLGTTTQALAAPTKPKPHPPGRAVGWSQVSVNDGALD